MDQHGSVPPSTRLHASAAGSAENLIMLPNAHGTVLMQNAPRLTLSDHESEDGISIGNAALLGPLFVTGPLTIKAKIDEIRDPEHLAKIDQFEERTKMHNATNQTTPFTEGYPQVPNVVSERLTVNSALVGQFPLRLSESGAAGQPSHSIAVEEPTRSNTLVLPDVMGTVITTGDLPVYYQDMISTDVLYFGDVSFLPRFDSGQPGSQPDLVFGSPDSSTLVEVNSVLRTRHTDGLVFEGALDDGHTTSLVAPSASGHNILTLPDTDGTVLMTASLPQTLPFLTVLDRVDIVGEGETILGGGESGGTLITLGAGLEHSSTWLHHTISGRFPMHFSGLPAPSSLSGNLKRADDGTRASSASASDPSEAMPAEEESDGGPSLRFQVTSSARHNVISLPDVSGTVVTTGNIDLLCALPHTPLYRMHANRIFLSTSQLLAFGAQASQLLERQKEPACAKPQSKYPSYSTPPTPDPVSEPSGSFAFLDSSHTLEARSKEMPKLDANSFYVRAHGGVRLVSGIVERSGGRLPLEIGVQIPPKSSGWSVLSDINSKTNVSIVDDEWVLGALVKVQVSTWQYQGSAEGAGPHGKGVTHMGPMAQDFNAALAPLNLGKTAANESVPGSSAEEDFSRIHTSDADGALLAATRAMISRIGTQQKTVQDLEEQVETLMLQLQSNNVRIERNRQSISRHGRIITSLQSLQKATSVASTPHIHVDDARVRAWG